MTCRPLDPFGIEIADLDLASPPSDETAKVLYDSWLKHQIIVFRNPITDGRRQVNLAKTFGPLQRHPFAQLHLPEEPDLIFLGSENDTLPVHIVDEEPRRGYLYWHSDLSYVPEINKGSLLRVETMPRSGGQTSFADAAGAYEDLPADLKRRISGLWAVHSARTTPRRPWGKPGMDIRIARPDEYPAVPQTPRPPLVKQPLVVTHGETGRQSLLLSPLSFERIEGMPTEEGDRLFDELAAHALSERYVYRHEWQMGDMVLWDNRSTMHYAEGYPPDQERKVIRATLLEGQVTGQLL